MTGLKRIPEVIERHNEVTFVSDRGQVKIFEWEGEFTAEIGFEEVSIDEFEQHLDRIATHDEFTDEAETFARDLIEQARQNTETETETEDAEDDDEPNDTETDTEDDDNTAEVVHTMDDGTEIRVGDRINHPGNWSYRIKGRADDHTLRKFDNTDDWGVTVSTAEKHIRREGFDERVEVSE